jgi:hypothetical protein
MYLVLAQSERAKQCIRRRKRHDFFTEEEIAGSLPNGLFLNESSYTVGRMLAFKLAYKDEINIYKVESLDRRKLLRKLQELEGWEPI